MRRLLGVLAVAAIVLAGALVLLRPDGPSPAMAATAASDDTIDKVLVISVDGLNPDALRALGREGTPALHRVMREGPFTLNARTSYERTRTLPNHTGMLTGRFIDRSAHGHGVWFNDDDAGTTVHAAAGEYVASTFDVVHDRGLKTALLATKEKFALYDRTWSAGGRADTVGTDNGRDKISRYVHSSDENALIEATTTRLLASTGPRYTFLHLAAPDLAGHAHGFMGAAYLDAVRAIDARIGRLMRTVRENPGLADHLAVIITSDHGGKAASHEDPAVATNYTVPFLVWGKGMPAGVDLYSFNAAYADPGTSRPTYAAAGQPIRNSSAANLALDLLDLSAVPGSQVDTGFTLHAYR